MNEKEYPNKIVTLLNAIGSDIYGKASVKTEADGFDTTTICWDGPCNWATLFGSGDSLFVEEFNDYSLLEESGISELASLASDYNLMFEPITGYQLGIYSD